MLFEPPGRACVTHNLRVLNTHYKGLSVEQYSDSNTLKGVHGNVAAHAGGDGQSATHQRNESGTHIKCSIFPAQHHALSMRRDEGAGAGAPLSSAGLNCSQAVRVVMVSTMLNCS